jgi:hypothetical protein
MAHEIPLKAIGLQANGYATLEENFVADRLFMRVAAMRPLQNSVWR